MKSIKVRLAAMLVGAMMAGGAANLQAATADEEVYRLGEVVVSGEASVVESVGVTHKVTAEEIQKRGVRTLDEAINLLPGVTVRVGGDGTPRIDIRGLRTRHVKLLLNGTPFNATSDGQFAPNLISVENIDEIVVTTGGASSLYGAGGNAGVINVITKKGARGAHGSAGVELAEGDTQLLRATAGYGADRYDVFVSGSLYERDYWELSDHFSPSSTEDGGERENSDYERDNLFANIGFAPTDATLIGMTVNYLKSDFGKPPVAVEDDFAPNLRYEREEDEGFNAQVALDHDFKGPLSFKGWAYYNKLNTLENRYLSDYETQGAGAPGTSRTDAETQISGINGQLRYDMQRYGVATLGVMYENNDYEALGFSVNNRGRLSTVDASGNFQLYATTFEYEVTPLPKLGLVLGGGYHWQDRADKSDGDYTYLVGLRYDLFDGTRLKASHARKIRFPTLRDLYDPERGNLDLDAEVTWNTEVGFEQDLPAATTVSLTGFYMDIEDFIERPDGEVQVQNYEKYEFYGVEVAAENRYFDELLLRASYSYLHSEDKSSDSNRDQLQNRPEHKVVLEAAYQLPWNMSVYGSAMWVANAYTYNDDVTIKKRIPEYLVFDFRLSKKVANALDLYFGIHNAFDADYVTSYGIPHAGRAMYGGVTWKF
jgi:outer membrane receptor protein involved in Fe transport